MARRRFRNPNYYYEEREDVDNSPSYSDPNEEMEMDILHARERYARARWVSIGSLILIPVLTWFLYSHGVPFELAIGAGLFILVFTGLMYLSAYFDMRRCEKRYQNKLSIREEFRGR